MEKTISYSVWAEPKGYVRHKLQEEIGHLASAHHAPTFTPHITLLGGISTYSEDFILNKVGEVANEIKAFCVRLTRPAAGRIFHQCVYILCEQDEPLLEAAASLRRAFGLSDRLSDYMPHLSLLYSDIDLDMRASIVHAETERLGTKEGLLSQALPIDTITLWRTPTEDKTLQSWTLLKEFPLRKD